MTDKTKIIAAIPAYNEEKYIGTVVLKTMQYVGEVIVVDPPSWVGLGYHHIPMKMRHKLPS
ncbi:hypothetical protein ES703_87507 [subsurface metagenome]